MSIVTYFCRQWLDASKVIALSVLTRNYRCNGTKTFLYNYSKTNFLNQISFSPCALLVSFYFCTEINAVLWVMAYEYAISIAFSVHGLCRYKPEIDVLYLIIIE